MPVLCCLCEDDVEKTHYIECTRCMSFNGDPFVYCMSCCDDRKAILVHQSNRGHNHLFKRVAPLGKAWFCDICRANLNGTTCYTCPTCTFDGGFDMCLQCGMASGKDSKRNHEHDLIPVLPDGSFPKSQLSCTKLPQPVTGGWCDSCGKEPVIGVILGCAGCCRWNSPCKKAGYLVCAKCADEERAAYLHWKWAPKKEKHNAFQLVVGK